ncbi:MAG: redoxin domain-containing protein [Deltaproteobacteria bacterium]|nr:redoxin domain-containing protein [Deltaproteobacteria bacterium]
MELEKATIGKEVPSFGEINTFNPKTGGFGTFSLEEAKKNKKWTVLVFYPADYTFVCPTELADFATKQDELEKLGAQIVSISTDTHFVHMAWQRDEKLLANVKFLMAADPTGKVSKIFGVYDENSGLAFRGTFIINPQGTLVASEVNFFNVGRNSDELLRKVKANIYVAENPNEVCPAKWNQGDKTLKPGENLVGKVYEALNLS